MTTILHTGKKNVLTNHTARFMSRTFFSLSTFSRITILLTRRKRRKSVWEQERKRKKNSKKFVRKRCRQWKKCIRRISKWNATHERQCDGPAIQSQRAMKRWGGTVHYVYWIPHQFIFNAYDERKTKDAKEAVFNAEQMSRTKRDPLGFIRSYRTGRTHPYFLCHPRDFFLQSCQEANDYPIPVHSHFMWCVEKRIMWITKRRGMRARNWNWKRKRMCFAFGSIKFQ